MIKARIMAAARKGLAEDGFRAVQQALALVALTAALAVVLAGCTPSQEEAIRQKMTPSFEPTNTYAVPQMPAHMRRVALLPMSGRSRDEDQLARLDTVFTSELNKRLLFEVVPVSADTMKRLFGRTRFDSAELLPADFLRKVTAATNADGIVFLDLTRYEPYQPLSIGVRSKLVDATSGVVLWSFDTVFDAGNPTVAMAARRYQGSQGEVPFPMDSTGSVLQSPERFAKYAAAATFSTMPSHLPPPEPAKKAAD